uniref:Uncharacterized protein n=1 Tax=Nelumbo nucifera TaxID=4432 RepID=A0A822Y1I5_NELNU|nr:TPA_asm: hypothetical protein HUJ06_027311 [Nelumbo nucifera]
MDMWETVEETRACFIRRSSNTRENKWKRKMPKKKKNSCLPHSCHPYASCVGLESPF